MINKIFTFVKKNLFTICMWIIYISIPFVGYMLDPKTKLIFQGISFGIFIGELNNLLRVIR